MSDSCETILVPVNAIDKVWDKVKDFIALTSDETLNENDIYQYLIDGEYRLFIILELESKQIITAYATCIAFYPRHKACRIISLGGSKLSEWYNETITYVENYAKEEKCDYMEVFGRRGWVKIMKGYKEEGVILRKHLINKG